MTVGVVKTVHRWQSHHNKMAAGQKRRVVRVKAAVDWLEEDAQGDLSTAHFVCMTVSIV